jgi:hypothetical protein
MRDGADPRASCPITKTITIERIAEACAIGRTSRFVPDYEDDYIMSACWVCSRTISCSVTIPIGVSSAGDTTTKRLIDLSIILETASRMVASGCTVSAGRNACSGV